MISLSLPYYAKAAKRATHILLKREGASTMWTSSSFTAAWTIPEYLLVPTGIVSLVVSVTTCEDTPVGRADIAQVARVVFVVLWWFAT